jgi:hypothetical protein
MLIGAARHGGTAACYLNKVTISIKTGVFNADIVHSADGKS